MLLQRARAEIVAKEDSAADLWRSRVALERATQARLAKERELRLFILDSKLASAAEMQSLEEAKLRAERERRERCVDSLMAEQAWVLGKRLSDDELARMESTAEARMSAALERLVSSDCTDLPTLAIHTAGTGWNELEAPSVGEIPPPLSASLSFPDTVEAEVRGSPDRQPCHEAKSHEAEARPQLSYYNSAELSSMEMPQRVIAANFITNKKSMTSDTTCGLSGAASSGLDFTLSTRDIAGVPQSTRSDLFQKSEGIYVTQQEPVESGLAMPKKLIPRSSPTLPLNSRAINTALPKPKVSYESSIAKNAESTTNKITSPVISSSLPTQQRHLEAFKPFSAWCENRSKDKIGHSTSDTSESLYNSTQQRYLAIQRRALGAGKKVGFASGRGADDSIRPPRSPFTHSKPTTSQPDKKPASSLPYRPKLYDNMPRSASLPDHSAHPPHRHGISPSTERLRAFYANHRLDPSGLTASWSDISTSSTSISPFTNTMTMASSTFSGGQGDPTLAKSPLPVRTTSARAQSIAAASYPSESTGKVETIPDPSDEVEDEIPQKAHSIPECSASIFSSKLDAASAASIIDYPHRDSYYYLPPQPHGGIPTKR
ncbi:unnamed protein product [Phytomonas sp. Hart1]|nr:unnamed protein product [Phytomonas sp. Hart1]|eukprot:CCW69900.1 unnamed protein product [Phytomonas sp. isolate Hart1]